MIERAFKHIISHIIHHRVMPGNALYETVIAEELSMSRTPIKQAFNSAVSLGILERKKGKRGYFLPVLEYSDMLYAFSARKAIEKQLILEAAENATPEGIREMESLIEEEKMLLNEKNIYLYALINQKIHFCFAKHSGNVYLQRIFPPVFWRNSLYDFYLSKTYRIESLLYGNFDAHLARYKENYNSQEQSHEQHKKIVSSIKSKNYEALTRSINSHFSAVIELNKKNFIQYEMMLNERRE